MKTETAALPQKILARKDEITAGFLQIAHTHIKELMTGQAPKRFHATDFASRLFIHPRHLTNTIKLTMNTSPCDVMEALVLAQAQKLLKETGLSVAEIGQRFAYSEPTNFTKFFKSMTGITPLQYRKG